MSKVEKFLIKRGNNQYEVVIGLEVPAQELEFVLLPSR